jgi:DivIVA domain-containing protein
VTLLQILVVLAVVAAVAVVAAGVWRHGDTGAGTAGTGAGAEGHSGVEVGLPEPTSSLPMLQLPADRLTGQDVDRLRFSIGLRGYRMDEVDQVLDRVSAELRSRQAEVDELRERLEAGPPDVHGEPVSESVAPPQGQDVGEP